jgi:hypothetical protein
VAYVYAPDRKAKRPIAHLAGFKGVLQVDGYDGYRVLAERGDVELAFCWSHVRRRFYELATAGSAPIASEALEHIAALYRIQTEIRGCGADERRAARGEKSRPIIEMLQPWLCEKLSLISQKSKLAEAIRYTLSRWKGLTRFLDDGRIEIDSNIVERAIRPIALNRKNALFAGSDGGGEHWAIVASLIETCKLGGIDPQTYICRRHHQDRQRSSQQPYRRAPAVGLCPRRKPQGRGLRTALTHQQRRACLDGRRPVGLDQNQGRYRRPRDRRSTMAPAIKESGNSGPASSAIWPVRARIPAPIITPVPMAMAPGKVMPSFL